MTLSLILYLKAKQSVSVLKEHAKAAAILAKARAASAAGSHRGKAGKDGGNKGQTKEAAKKVSEVLMEEIHFYVIVELTELPEEIHYKTCP